MALLFSDILYKRYSQTCDSFIKGCIWIMDHLSCHTVTKRHTDCSDSLKERSFLQIQFVLQITNIVKIKRLVWTLFYCKVDIIFHIESRYHYIKNISNIQVHYMHYMLILEKLIVIYICYFELKTPNKAITSFLLGIFFFQ